MVLGEHTGLPPGLATHNGGTFVDDDDMCERIKRYRGRVRPTGSAFWRVSRDAMDLRANFPIHIGSGVGFRGATI